MGFILMKSLLIRIQNPFLEREISRISCKLILLLIGNAVTGKILFLLNILVLYPSYFLRILMRIN